MVTREAEPQTEPVSVKARRYGDPPRIPSLLMLGGPIVAAAAVAGIVVLAALTSWWVLFALFALPPLLMLSFALPMMSARGSPMGTGSCAAWRVRWLRSDVDRATRAQ